MTTEWGYAICDWNSCQVCLHMPELTKTPGQYSLWFERDFPQHWPACLPSSAWPGLAMFTTAAHPTVLNCFFPHTCFDWSSFLLTCFASQYNSLNHHSIVIGDEMVGIFHRNRDTLWKRPSHKQNPEPVAGDAETLQLFYCALQVCNLGTTNLQLRVGLRSSYTDNNYPSDQDMTGNSTASAPTLHLCSDEEDIAGHTEATGKMLCSEITHSFPEHSISITTQVLQEFPRPHQYLHRCTKPVFAKAEFRYNLDNLLQGQEDTAKANFACYNARSVCTASLRG